MSVLQTVPLAYRKTVFRSSLEADWAATLDDIGIAWSYEPLAIDLGDGVRYLCDFYLPAQRIWLEIKGPHDQRMHKPRRLHQMLNIDEWDWRSPLVVIGRVAEAGCAVWHGVTPDQNIILRHCERCEHHSFMDLDGTWECQVCGNYERHCGNFYISPDNLRVGYTPYLPFGHAPRPWENP